MKPIIKWAGGKAREIEHFKKFYPTDFNRYVEPFVGGGAVFFDLEFEGENVINDVHQDLINFYRQIKEGNSKIIYEYMLEYPNDKETYYYIRNEFCPKNVTEKAFRFYYQRKTAYRGMSRYNKSGKFNVPYGAYKTINFEDLLNDEYEKLLKRTKIYQEDFQVLFEKYNGEENFFFLDPPYDSTFTNYGYCEFGKDEHRRLSELFKNTKSKCLMVIGETDFIKDLYSGYIKDRFYKKYAFRIYDEVSNHHLVITNY